MIRSVLIRAGARRTERGEELDLPFRFPDLPVKIGRHATAPLFTWQIVLDDQDPRFARITAHASFKGRAYADLRGKAGERAVFDAEWDEDDLAEIGRKGRRRGKVQDRPLLGATNVTEFIPPHHF